MWVLLLAQGYAGTARPGGNANHEVACPASQVSSTVQKTGRKRSICFPWLLSRTDQEDPQGNCVEMKLAETRRPARDRVGVSHKERSGVYYRSAGVGNLGRGHGAR